MRRDDMDFFHQATKKICGSLDINAVLGRCLDFFQAFMPLTSISMSIYDPATRSIVNIATAGPAGFWPTKEPVPLPDEAVQHIEEDKGAAVEIINRPEKHIVGKIIWKAIGRKKVSCLVHKLEIEDEELGVVVFLTRGGGSIYP